MPPLALSTTALAESNVTPLRGGDVPPTPTLPYGEFLKYMRANWNQGEHVTMIGTTGSGKTTLLRQFIGLRDWVAIFAVKGRDDSMDRFLQDGYTKTTRWVGPELDSHLVLWPPVKGYGHAKKQRQVFEDAIDAVYREGGWCCVFDEAAYLSDTLKLGENMKFLLQQGRSSGISVVGMTQRPAFIPLAFYDQATHLFFWRDNDRRNLQRIGELAGNARQRITMEVAELQRREVLYLHKDSGYRVKTTVEV